MLEAYHKAIKRKIVSVGILPTAKLITNYLANKIYYRESFLYYVDIQSYSFNPQDISKQIVGKGVRYFTELSSKDIASIKDYAGEKYIQEVERRLSNKWRLFLAYVSDELAGACWALGNDSEFKTKVVPLLDGDVLFLNAWTIDSFRGNHIFTFLLSFMIIQYKKENFKRAYGCIHGKNIGSIKAHEQAGGWRHFTNYEVYKLFGREIVIWKPTNKKK